MFLDIGFQVVAELFHAIHPFEEVAQLVMTGDLCGGLFLTGEVKTVDGAFLADDIPDP